MIGNLENICIQGRLKNPKENRKILENEKKVV